MNGSEISKELGVTRQAISQMLKRSLGKIYKETKKLDKEMSPFETAVMAVYILQIDTNDIGSFFKLFPPDIRTEIKEDAYKKYSRS